MGPLGHRAAATLATAALALLLATLALACEEPSDARAGGTSPSAAGAPPPPAAPAGSAPRGVVTAPGAASPDGIEVGADAAVPPPEGREESAGCAPKDPKLKPLQLLRFSFTSAVEGKAPTDRLRVARPGQRVWAHFVVRNRSGEARCVHLAFRVGGEIRTELDLDVGESWSWRTFAYATLRSSDTSGQLEIEAIDDQGKVLARERLPIVPAPKR
jgi:hypothetical protein